MRKNEPNNNYSDKDGTRLIDLPALDESTNNMGNIYNLLSNGDAIWAWHKGYHMYPSQRGEYSIFDKDLINGTAGILLIRKEDDLIAQYRGALSHETLKVQLKICKFYNFNRTSLSNIYANLHGSYQLLLDEKQTYVANCSMCAHDLTKDQVNAYLKSCTEMTIGDEHIFFDKLIPVAELA